MSNPIQNFYKSTITNDWSIGTGIFYISIKPTTSSGRLVISPSSDTLREIIEYTSTGTDANGDYIVVSVRGVGDTTEQTHTLGEKVRMNITAEDWEDMRDDIDSIVAAGAPDISTTQKGIGELATPAQIDALTENGETGAPLLINPKQLGDAHNIPHVAPGTSGNVMVSNGTDWTSYSTTPIFQQIISSNFAGDLDFNYWASGSNSDGSVLFYLSNYSTDPKLRRFERDTNSGAYIMTHSVSITNLTSGDSGSIVYLGNYIYLFRNNGTNISCYRYLASDGTGEQAMTVPTVACTTFCKAWTDGTYVYIVSAIAGTVCHKWSLSGTTFSAVTTSTVTTGIFATQYASTMFDGTTPYMITTADWVTFTIIKITTVDGTVYTTITKLLPKMSDLSTGSFIIQSPNSKIIYVGQMYKVYDEAAATQANVILTPISKP